MKNPVILKRLKAFAIDYLLILLYIGILLCGTLLTGSLFHLQFNIADPITGEITGFLTLTLPVMLYFTLSENGQYAASIGKRKLGLQVVTPFHKKAGFGQLLLRNGIKFLPWEMAHFYIYRLFYNDPITKNTPDWVLTGLILAQALAVIYFLCILFNKNNRSIYEILSGTCVVETVRN
ncbi:MAG: RDD family protein [Terrimonas sp.]|nr:RDD family protein [Terrimonas sp.]